MPKLTYARILQDNEEARQRLTGPKYRVQVLSNITVFPIKDILKHSLHSGRVNAVVTLGGYDNIVQDSAGLRNADAVIIFWELANLIDGFQYRANILSKPQLRGVIAKAKSEIDRVFTRLQKAPLVLINRFSSGIFNSSVLDSNAFDRVRDELNRYVEDRKPANVFIVDIDKVLAGVSIGRSCDLRFYYSAKAIYSVEFYRAYSEFVKPYFMAANGKARKALVFDCDGTLWKGVLGEDGLRGIDISPHTAEGAVFSEVQALAVALSQKGVLIGLASKNDPADVEEVLTRHPDMLLKAKHITAKKVNWEDKAANIQAIASELNIGLDSIVFIDDSDFEVQRVRRALPDVAAFKVPEKLHEYPQLVRGISSRFFSITRSAEDKNRAGMYRAEGSRRRLKSAAKDMQDYLRSLRLKLEVTVNDRAALPRLSQLTQKTNQFNLTTRRYSEARIKAFMDDPAYRVFSFSLSDRFGAYGLTGMCIVRLFEKQQRAEIDSFLMSCRVIGRTAEFAFLNVIMRHLKQLGVSRVEAAYQRTPRNAPAGEFYGQAGLQLTGRSGVRKNYLIKMNEYVPQKTSIRTGLAGQ